MHQLFEGEVAHKSEIYETQQEVHKLTYTWNIRTFQLYEANHLVSPIFSTNNYMEPSWSLSLNKADEESKYFGLYLSMNYYLAPQVRGFFKVTLLNNKGEEVKTKTRRTLNFVNWTPYGFEKFAKKSCLYKLAAHNIWQIVCEVTYSINKFDFPDQQRIKQQKGVQQELCQNFQNLLENENFSDVTLFVEGEKFRAHKVILAARSKVFAAMFEQEMQETKTNCVFIKEIRPEVFREMLTFMYSGNAPNLEELAMELLAAADMYALDKLKVMCEQTIRANLCIQSSVDSLILAYLHSSEELKAEAIDFINAHINKVVETESWQTMKKSRFNHLVYEVYQVMATKPVAKCKVCS